jgi:hypothetical protein
MNGRRWTIKPAMKAASRAGAVGLGHHDRALRQASRGEGRCHLRPSVESVGTFAGFHLSELVQDGDAFGLGEAGDRGSPGFDAQA